MTPYSEKPELFISKPFRLCWVSHYVGGWWWARPWFYPRSLKTNWHPYSRRDQTKVWWWKGSPEQFDDCFYSSRLVLFLGRLASKAYRGRHGNRRGR